MSLPASSNGNGSGSNLQRIVIGAGTLIVVVLTVIIAIFLTLGEVPEGEPTTVPSPTTIVVATPSPTFTPPAAPSPTDTPSLTPTPIPPTPIPTDVEEPVPTATDTPLPPLPTFTSTLLPVAPSPTGPPAPAADQPIIPCQSPPSWVEYEAQVGDTFDSLARRTGTTVADLLEVNCPETATLQAGQVIYLPMTPPTPTVTHTPSPTRQPAATPIRTATPINPRISSVTPRQVDKNNEEFIITVLGENFRTRETGFKVELRGPKNVPLQLREITLSETNFDAIVPADLVEGTYDLVITNPDGQSGVRSSALIVGQQPTPTPPTSPKIDDFIPTSGEISKEVELLIEGENFQPDNPDFAVELRATDSNLRVKLRPGDTLTTTRLRFIIPANELEPGDYKVVVFNNQNEIAVSSDEYEAVN